MGYNSAILVLNDALGEIEKSPDHFVRGMVRAINQAALNYPKHGVEFSVGQSVVAGCNHADGTQLIAFGGNRTTHLGVSYGADHHTPEGQERILREWAGRMGYRLVRKAKNGTR